MGLVRTSEEGWGLVAGRRGTAGDPRARAMARGAMRESARGARPVRGCAQDNTGRPLVNVAAKGGWWRGPRQASLTVRVLAVTVVGGAIASFLPNVTEASVRRRLTRSAGRWHARAPRPCLSSVTDPIM